MVFLTFKMEKHIIDRRLSILEKEGIKFFPNTEVGKDLTCDKLKKYDALFYVEEQPLKEIYR